MKQELSTLWCKSFQYGGGGQKLQIFVNILYGGPHCKSERELQFAMSRRSFGIVDAKDIMVMRFQDLVLFQIVVSDILVDFSQRIID